MAEQLGRYVLDRKLASGGMAEVFLARQVGPNNFEKACVVKRMLAHLSEDLTFVEMFLDEARLAARLAHPGIAQIFDFGHERDTYYLAMEYVPGANLKMVLEGLLVKNQQVPLHVAARIVSLVATALDYAHHATDEKGRPLELIHRDVSPQNVMVSVSGDVKLIDFGIAKAATDSHRTVAGTLKGKYAYMSPEQLRQQHVDQRTDIYALGLVFYELLTGRPAVAPSDNVNALMVAAAQRRYAPLEQFRSDVPKRVKGVLDRALALSPADRFQSARELGDQLEDWLTSTGVRVKPSELAALVGNPVVTLTDPPGNETVASAASPAKKKPSKSIDEDVPPTMTSNEARTLQDMPAPRELRSSDRRSAELPTNKGADVDRTPMLGSSGVERRDASFDPTPVLGTPPVGRRSTEADLSLVPTMPEKQGPDIAAIMAQTRRQLGERSGPNKPPPPATTPSPQVGKPGSSKFMVAKTAIELEPETGKVFPAPMPQTPEPSRGGPVPLTTAAVPAPTTALIPGSPESRRPRRWPWVLLIVVLLPIGAVAGAIEFLPESSPVRAQLMQVVAPLLQRVGQLRQ